MKYLKYIFILVIASFCFMFIDNVCALSNLNGLSNLTIDENGRFYNNVNNTSSSIGYSMSKVGEDSLAYYSAFPTGSTQYVNGGAGGSIVQCNMSFAKNNYYSVTYFWLSDSASYYYHPFYTNLTNKLAIGNNANLSLPNFTYDSVSTELQRKLIEGLGYLSSYTVVFKAPQNGTCLLSAFSSNPTSPSDGLAYVGYSYESLGSDSLSIQDIQTIIDNKYTAIYNKIDASVDALNVQIQNKIDSSASSINSNIDELKEKQDELNETSKGIWQTIKDGFASVGNWFIELREAIGNFFKDLASTIGNFFVDLFNKIKALFVGEEVCQTTKQNLFTGYDLHGDVYPDENGWITISNNSTSRYLYLWANSKDKLEVGKTYNIFLEIAEATGQDKNSRFTPIYHPLSSSTTKPQLSGDPYYRFIYLNDLSFDGYTVKDNIYNIQITATNGDYLLYTALFGYSTIKYRLLVTDDLSMTVDNYEYFTEKKECHTDGGLFGKVDKQTETMEKIDDTINDSDTSGASSEANGFFDNFEDSNYGLSDVITMPLNTIKGITSSTCTPLKFPLPFVDKEVELPCMSSIYSNFGPILTIYQTITFGMIAYWVCINTFATVRKFKDPDSDEIEVVSL